MDEANFKNLIKSNIFSPLLEQKFERTKEMLISFGKIKGREDGINNNPKYDSTNLEGTTSEKEGFQIVQKLIDNAYNTILQWDSSSYIQELTIKVLQKQNAEHKIIDIESFVTPETLELTKKEIKTYRYESIIKAQSLYWLFIETYRSANINSRLEYSIDLPRIWESDLYEEYLEAPTPIRQDQTNF